VQTRNRQHAAGDRWIVQGFDGNKPFDRLNLPKPSWSEPRVICLLQRLVCRHLTVKDVLDASRAPRDQSYNSVLKEHRDAHGKRLTITVGTDPYYVASLWKADEEDD
jgi:hypothetical protein